jgi:hypothetical protein
VKRARVFTVSLLFTRSLDVLINQELLASALLFLDDHREEVNDYVKLVDNVPDNRIDRRSTGFHWYRRHSNSDRVGSVRCFLSAVSRQPHHGPRQSWAVRSATGIGGVEERLDMQITESKAVS